MTESKFEKRLELRRKHCPPGLVEAMVFVNDTLEMADSIADDLFGEENTPEAVIEIYRLIAEQYEIKKRELEQEEDLDPHF
jgi:hypothetical protein